MLWCHNFLAKIHKAYIAQCKLHGKVFNVNEQSNLELRSKHFHVNLH